MFLFFFRDICWLNVEMAERRQLRRLCWRLSQDSVDSKTVWGSVGHVFVYGRLFNVCLFFSVYFFNLLGIRVVVIRLIFYLLLPVCCTNQAKLLKYKVKYSIWIKFQLFQKKVWPKWIWSINWKINSKISSNSSIYISKSSKGREK